MKKRSSASTMDDTSTIQLPNPPKCQSEYYFVQKKCHYPFCHWRKRKRELVSKLFKTEPVDFAQYVCHLSKIIYYSIHLSQFPMMDKL